MMDKSGISSKPLFFNDSPGVDCKFLVGAKDKEELITGHKAIFAKASPVFYNMFCGSVPEQGDEIKVPDIQPEAFHTMVDFLYTGEVKLSSVEHAVQVWYTAHKYDLEKLTKPTINYLKNDVTTKNVCYILEFAIAFKNETVMDYCREVIAEDTATVLNDPSFLEADLSALKFILDQDELEVSEVVLFKALARYINAQNNIVESQSMQVSFTSPANSESGDVDEKEVSVPDGNSDNSCGEGSSRQERTEMQGERKANCSNPLKELVKKIRFLTMTPEEFQECYTKSLLSDSEGRSILINIFFPTDCTHPMPKGFSKIRIKRELHQLNAREVYPYLQMVPSIPIIQRIVHVIPKNLPRYIKFSNQNYVKSYCNHAVGKSGSFLNSSNLEGILHFKTNIHILITGVQVINPLKNANRYNSSYVTCTIEILNKRNVILYNNGVSINCSGNSGKDNSFAEIPFLCPIYIHAKRDFIISVKFKNASSVYPHKCLSSCKVNNVIFEFKRSNQGNCECMGLIRSIVFTNVEESDCNNE